MTESQADKAGLGDHWRAAMKKRLERQARKLSAKEQLMAAAKQILDVANAEDWSQREASRRAGLSWGAFRRCRDGRNDPVTWLPKIQAALNKVLAARH